MPRAETARERLARLARESESPRDTLRREAAKYDKPKLTAAEQRRKNARDVGNAAKGLLVGGADVGGRIAGGVGKLAGALGAQGVEDYVERVNANVRNIDTKGKAATGGRLAGNVIGEGALAVTGGRAVGNAIRAAAPASKLAKAIAAGRKGSVAQRVAAQTLPFAPAEAALGAVADTENPLRGAALNLALGVGGGALIEGAPAAARALKNADLRPELKSRPGFAGAKEPGEKTVRLREGVVRLLQLDDPGTVSGLGLKIEKAGKSEVRITGSVESLHELERLVSHAGNFAGESWYPRTSAAAVKAIRKVAGPAPTKPWESMPTVDVPATAGPARKQPLTLERTPQDQWVSEGDEVVDNYGRRGKAQKIVPLKGGAASVNVVWENGETGFPPITRLRKADSPPTPPAAAAATAAPAERMVRLYRVEPKDFGDQGDWLRKALTPAQYESFVAERGRLFADNLDDIRNYGHDEATHTTYFVDVPESVAAKVRRKNVGQGDEMQEYLLPPEFVARKAPLTASPPAAAAAAPGTEALDDLPDDVFEQAIRFTTTNDPAAAETARRAIDANPALRQRITDRFRSVHGDRVTVYRAGDVTPGRPQSWTTDRAVAEQLSRFGPDGKPTSTPRPIVTGSVAPEKILFPGMQADAEVVLNSADVALGRTPANRPGFINPAVMAQGAATVGGALTGAAMDDENRTRGALLGAAAGAGAAVGATRLVRGASNLPVPATPSPTQQSLANAPIISRLVVPGVGAATGAAMNEDDRVGGALTGAAIAATFSGAAGRGIAKITPAPVKLEARRLASKIYSEVFDENYMARLFGRTVGGNNTISHRIDLISGAKGAAEEELEVFLAVHRDIFRQARPEASALAHAERIAELASNGSKDVTPQQLVDAWDTIARLRKNPLAVQGAEAIQRAYADLLHWKYAEGVINDEQYTALKKMGLKYTPLIPDWAVQQGKNVAGVDFGVGGRLLAPGTGVRKLRSRVLGTTPIVDMVEQYGVDFAQTHLLVAKQRVTNAVAEIAAANPAAAADWLRPVKAPAPGQTLKGNIVSANLNGRRQYFEVVNDELYETLTKVTPRQLNAVQKFLGKAKNVFRTGVTFVPDFVLANGIRDAIHVAAQQGNLKGMLAGSTGGAAIGAWQDEDNRLGGALKGGAFGLGAGALAPSFARTLVSMGEVLGDKEIYREFVREGGTGFSEFYGNRKDVQKLIRNALDDRSFRDTILFPAKQFVDGFSFFAHMVEMAPRLAKYKHARKMGLPVDEAVSLAKDISVNFSNIGASSSIKNISNHKAFFNAKLQGWDKLGRMLKDPKTRYTAAALITAPSIALFHVNKDDPEYWDRPVWERSMFWLVPREEGGFYRIMKPFELGFLFATVPEMILAKTYEKDREGLSRSLREIVQGEAEGLLPIPTAGQAPFEAITNYSLFTGQRLRDKDLPNTEEFDERTSETAVRIGGATNASPILIDHLARGAGGSMATEVTGNIDKLLTRGRAPQVEPRRPFVQRFFTSRTNMGEGERRLREKLRAGEAAHRALVEREKNAPERVPAIMRNYGKQIEFYRTHKWEKGQLDKAAAFRKKVRGERNMTVQEKTEKLAELNAAIRTLIYDKPNFRGLPNLEDRPAAASGGAVSRLRELARQANR